MTKTKAKVTETPLSIPALQLFRMEVTITGMTDLLLNRPSEATIRCLEMKAAGVPTSKPKAVDPEEVWRAKLHIICSENGKPAIYGFPAGGIQKAVAKVGAQMTKHAQSTVFGAICIPCDLVPIIAPEPTMHTRWGINHNAKDALIVVHRPRFTNWSMRVPLVVDESKFSRDEVVNLLNHTGYLNGIGSFRPECKGTFGQFKVDTTQEVVISHV